MKETFHLNINTADNLGIGLFKCALNLEGSFIAVNSTLATMLGYSCKVDLRNQGFRELFAATSAAEEFFRLMHRDCKVNFFEAKFKRKEGDALWVAVTASKVAEPNKREYIEGIIENISSHKEMEEKFALERDIIQGLLDNIPDAIYFKDRQNRIIKVNNFYAEGMKLAAQEIIGKTDLISSRLTRPRR